MLAFLKKGAGLAREREVPLQPPREREGEEYHLPGGPRRAADQFGQKGSEEVVCRVGACEVGPEEDRGGKEKDGVGIGEPLKKTM